MVNIIDRLWLGSDNDFAEAKKRGYAILSCCKDGDHGHRSILKYTTVGAPKGKDYYYVQRGNHMALNLIDSEDPNYIPIEVIQPGIDFIKSNIENNNKILVQCNMGHSRSPTVVLLYMRTVGEMPHTFPDSEKVFKKLYPKYSPGNGVLQFAKDHWQEFKNINVTKGTYESHNGRR